MAHIIWDVSYSVKVAEIDNQHKKLIELNNELNDALMQGKGTEILGTILSGLIKYTATHFKTEEQYFDRFGYSETTSHKKEHSDFLAKVVAFKEGLDKRELTVSVEVLKFLSEWLRNHIKGSDMKYINLFHENGVH